MIESVSREVLVLRPWRCNFARPSEHVYSGLSGGSTMTGSQVVRGARASALCFCWNALPSDASACCETCGAKIEYILLTWRDGAG